ncbi:DNA-binding transcriptional LysR family regulator [Marinomonas communis]|uniref:DNA-binding transcriptional LysR family regulator n=2 Tax=Marinomonas communis TaxID=28254 RepID=A0A4R6X9T4_9GAMM|nr:DNA-binding transcriptional LysR family regulator [Marinomonas communis]
MRQLPSLTALRVFEVAGKQLSFTMAAKQLYVTQGAVSRQIKQLEDYLGVPLFVRMHHKLELTDSGRQLLQKIEQSFDLIETAVTEIRDPKLRQKLNILVPPTLATRWLARRLTEFHKRFPELEVSVYDHPSEHVLFDCEIRFGRMAKPKHFSEMLFLEQHVPVCLPDMIDRAQNLTLEAGNLLHILHEGERLPVWRDWLEAAGLHQQVDADRGLSFSTLDQAISALKAGTGFAVIEKHMISRELEEGRLAQFSDIEVSGPYGYWLDIPPERQGLSKVVFFREWLHEQLA